MTKRFLVRCDRFGEGLLPGIVALEAIIAAYNKQPLPLTDCMSQGECPFEVWLAELVRHRLTKGSVTDRLHLNRRATPRLHIVSGSS
jgi:hypothetical protein